jgi:hypothetical protein
MADVFLSEGQLKTGLRYFVEVQKVEVQIVEVQKFGRLNVEVQIVEVQKFERLNAEVQIVEVQKFERLNVENQIGDLKMLESLTYLSGCHDWLKKSTFSLLFRHFGIPQLVIRHYMYVNTPLKSISNKLTPL